MQHWVQVFRDILDEDNFLPIQVYCNYQFKRLTYLYHVLQSYCHTGTFARRI
jgi:hypothetical protein